MTHPQEQNSEWIEWSGGAMPVDRNQFVEIMCRDGWHSYFPQEAYVNDYWNWTGSKYDIVAYRLHKPTPSSQGDAQ